MKRGGPLRRTGGLPRTAPLVARTPLVRHSPLRSAAPGAPRPPFRVQRPTPLDSAEKRARQLVQARAGDGLLCEICGRRPGAEWSHRKPRSAGRDGWCPSNGIWACSDLSAPDGVEGCHQRAHRNPRDAYRNGWFVRRAHDPARVPVRLACGLVLLDGDGGMTPTELQPDEET